MVELAESVDGILRASELSRDRVEDATTVLKVGDEVEAKFIGVDRKSRQIMLSIKAKDMEEEKQVMADYKNQTVAANPMQEALQSLKSKMGASSGSED